MKRALGLLYNKDERMMLRSILQDNNFTTVALPSTADEAWAEIGKPGQLDLVVFDERFEILRTAQRRGAGLVSSLELAEYFEEFRRCERYSPDSVICVVMGEGRGPEHSLPYLELGADLLLYRPLGTKDLREKMEEATRSLNDPSPTLKLHRALRRLFEAGDFAGAREGFGRLFALNPQDLHAGLFYAKSEIALGNIGQALLTLEQLDELHPGSLMTKQILIELYGEAGRPDRQIAKAVGLLALQPGARYFETTLALADTLRQKEGHGAGYHQLFDALARLNLPHAAEWRLKALIDFGRRIASVQDAEVFLGLVEQHPEARPSLRKCLETLFESITQAGAQGWAPAQLQCRAAGHLLEVETGHPAALTLFTELCIEGDAREAAWKRIERARADKRTSPELYAAWAKLALIDGHLKDASDAIHAGRRLRPNDEIWDLLAQQWRDKHEG